MSADPLRNYDAWLEEPYQRRAREEAELECPECGEQMEGDSVEQWVKCHHCGYENGVDWDAVAEAKAEARAEARAERYDF